MEIHKPKKVLTLAARSISLFLILLSTNALCQVWDGQFTVSKPGEEISYTINFYNGRFQEISNQHLGMSEIASGYYWTVKDTLFQLYEKRPTAANYVVEKKEKLIDILDNPLNDVKFSLEITSKSAEKKIPVNVVLMSKENKVLKGLIPDSLGRLEITLAACSEVDRILCSSFTDDFAINVSEFRGFSATIKVILSDEKVRSSRYAGLVKFLVKESNKKSFKLLQINNGILFTYERRKI
jgi:hypothetical protein